MGIISGLINGISNIFTSHKNREAQKEQQNWAQDFENKKFNNMVDNQNYQRALQQQIFNREDNAIQRRAEDMEKAGFSKLLAAGQPANAGQSVGMESGGGGNSSGIMAGKYDQISGFEGGVENVFNAMTMRQNIRQSKSEEILTREKSKTEAVERERKTIETLLGEKNIAKTESEIKNINKSIDEANARIRNINATSASTEYDLDMSKRTGTKTKNAMNTHEIYNTAAAAGNAIDNAINDSDIELVVEELEKMSIAELMNWKTLKGDHLTTAESKAFNAAMKRAKGRKK